MGLTINPLFIEVPEFSADGRPIQAPTRAPLTPFKIKAPKGMDEIAVGDTTLKRAYVIIDASLFDPDQHELLDQAEGDRLASLTLTAKEIETLGDVLVQAKNRKAERERQEALDAEDARLAQLEREAFLIKQRRAQRKVIGDPPFVRDLNVKG